MSSYMGSWLDVFKRKGVTVTSSPQWMDPIARPVSFQDKIRVGFRSHFNTNGFIPKNVAMRALPNSVHEFRRCECCGRPLPQNRGIIGGLKNLTAEKLARSRMV